MSSSLRYVTMRPEACGMSGCRCASPSRGPFGRSKKRTRSSRLVARHDLAGRVLDAVSHDEELDRRSLLVERTVDRIREDRRVTKRGDQDRDVGHAAPARRRSSASAATIAAPSAALDFGAGPPSYVLDEHPELSEERELTRRFDASLLGLVGARAGTRIRARPRRLRARRHPRRNAARRAVRAPATRTRPRTCATHRRRRGAR